jgi:hypothetical protein
VLHGVPELYGWGWATAELDATVMANDVMTSAGEHAAAEHALVLALARPQGRFGLSWLPAPRCAGSRATATTGARGGRSVRLVEALVLSR